MTFNKYSKNIFSPESYTQSKIEHLSLVHEWPDLVLSKIQINDRNAKAPKRPDDDLAWTAAAVFFLTFGLHGCLSGARDVVPVVHIRVYNMKCWPETVAKFYPELREGSQHSDLERDRWFVAESFLMISDIFLYILRNGTGLLHIRNRGASSAPQSWNKRKTSGTISK